jgi:hypothetical protein
MIIPVFALALVTFMNVYGHNPWANCVAVGIVLGPHYLLLAYREGKRGRKDTG